MVWYQKGIVETAEIFETSLSDGLSEEESQSRLTKYGQNAIRYSKTRTPMIMFLGQFKNLLVILLIGAAFVSFFLTPTGTELF